MPAGEYYDYHAKYVAEDTQYLCPGLHGAAETEMRALALEAFRTAGCSGWGRVDVMRDRNGANYLLEVNTAPGMTSHSLVPKAAKRVRHRVRRPGVARSSKPASTRRPRGSDAMMFATRKRNRRKPERAGRGLSLAWLKPMLAGGVQSALGVAGCWSASASCCGDWRSSFDRPIGQVEVGGQFQRVAPVQIEEVVAPFRGAGFLSVDLDALRAALESIPWVDRARVERRWPNGVRVFITEHVAAARWGEDGLMNTRGELFLRHARHIPPELPQLDRAGGHRSAGRAAVPRDVSAPARGRHAPVAGRARCARRVAAHARRTASRCGSAGRTSQARLERFIAIASPVVAAARRARSATSTCATATVSRSAGTRPRASRTAPRTQRQMPRKNDRNLIVGLDIGTSKVVAIVGEMTHDGRIEVVGLGSHPSRGLKRGVVVNIESTVQSIQRAVEEAELMAGCEIHSVYAGIAGSHVRSLNSHGIVAIRNKEVTSEDVDRVIDAARAVAIPADQKILHILPQEFLIDSQEGIREPIGMSGVRLEAKVHIVTGAESAAQNIVKCVQRCGLAVEDVVLEQLASSYAVLADDEKELGVCLVDIGGGTTDIAVFSGGAIRHTAVIPIAGDQVTNDIAVSLRTPTHHAEEIKMKFACALSQLANSDETIEVPSVGDRPPRRLARQTLAEVVEPRYEELFALIREELRRSGFEEVIAAGVVLTGGSAKMEGAVELAEEVFHMPVRLGIPQHITGLVDVVSNPIHSTGVGLLLYGRENYLRGRRDEPLGGNVRGVLDRMRAWFQGNF